MKAPWAATLALYAAVALAAVTAQPVDERNSRITATLTQMGVPVESSFQRFSGSVSYDPAQPEASGAKLSIETASWDIGDDEYNAEVRKPEWFDSAQHPTASFESTSIHPLGDTRFEAKGKLTLKGQTREISTVIDVKPGDGDTRRFSGKLPISRKAFGIGDPEWDEVLEDEVVVDFVIVTPL